MTALTDATFYAPLKTSLVLTNGTGGATSTRATTKNVFDNETKLITAPSSAIAFSGARMVANLFPSATDNASGLTRGRVILTNSAIADPDGTTKAGLYTLEALAGEHYLRFQVDTHLGRDINIHFRVKLDSYRYFGMRIQSSYNYYDLQTQAWIGTLQGINRAATITGDGWVTLEMTENGPTTGVTYGLIFPNSSLVSSWTPAGTETVTLYQVMMTDVTGQSDRSASEYVSVGALTTPWYGAGVDGVKYFATNKDLTAISDANLLGAHLDPASKTNTLLYCRDLTQLSQANLASAKYWQAPESVGAELVVNGGFDTDTSWTKGVGWVISAGAATATTASSNLVQTMGASTTAGVFYNLTITLSSVTAGLIYPRIGSIGSGGFYIQNNGTYTFTIKSAAAGSDLGLTAAASFSGVIDDLSVKKAAMQVTLTGTGITGGANSCSVITCLAANATILQTITAAAAAGCSAFWVKRGTGSGTIEFTRDNVTWTNITGLINSSTFTLVKIENTSVTNPVVGFRMGTVNDTIIVDAGLNHLGTALCEPILTTTAAVTRNAEVLTYQTASNFSDTAGTILATFQPTYDTWPAGSIVGKALFGLLASASNSGVQAADGTNTVNGAAGTPSGQRKIGARWSTGFLQAFYDGTYGTSGAYDGAFNLLTIAINSGAPGYVKNIAIFNSQLSNESVRKAWRPESLKVSALSNLIVKPVRENLTLLYATNWAGVTQAAPSELLASGAKRYQNAGTSATSQAIVATGNSVTIITQIGIAYEVGDFVQMVSGANSMKGDITAYDNVTTGSLTFYVQYSTGSGTYSSWTVGGTIPAGRNTVGNIKFVGVDTQTGFPLPAGTPIFARVNTTFGMYVIDWVDGFPTNDAAGLAASAATTYESVTINGVTTTALVIDQTQTVAPNCTRVGYKKQTWGTFHRDVAAAADLPALLIRYDLWINDLVGKFTSTNKRVTIADFKTGSASQGGDFRYVVTLIYADSADAAAFIVPVGTIGWEIVIDNKANSTGPELGGETFVSIKIFNLSIPVPTEQFFKFDVYWKRAASYADVSSGRFLVRYKLQGAANYVTVLDVNAASIAAYNSANSTSWVNRHMGVRGNMWQRMFFLGLYGRYAYTNMKVKCANLEVWNGLID